MFQDISSAALSVFLTVVPVTLTQKSFASSPPPSLPSLDYSRIAPHPAPRATWTARGATAPATLVRQGSRTFWKMTCNFKKGARQRVAWDRKVSLDLRAGQGIQFKLFCSNIAPISGFTCYFKSGNGWYSAAFEQKTENDWSTIRINKSDTSTEGRPAGWAHISAIRIAAWRGQNANTVFYLADMGRIRTDTPLLVIRNESAPPQALPAIRRYAQIIGEHFRHQDIPFDLVSDSDITPSLLAKKKLVVLPHNPHMPAEQVKELVTFLGAGGRLLSFYTLPQPLASAAHLRFGKHQPQRYPGYFAAIRADTKGLQGLPTQVNQQSWNIVEAAPVTGHGYVAAHWYQDNGRSTDRPAIIVTDKAIHMTHVLLSDDPPGKRALLLALVGHFLPDLWLKTAHHALAEAEQIGNLTQPGEAYSYIQKKGKNRKLIQNHLQKTKHFRSQAQQAIREKQYAHAVRQATLSRQELIRAYCALQTPLKKEHRGVWCHNAFGVDGMSWDQAIRTLAENGFTAIYPNMSWAGKAYYRSKVLPRSSLVDTKGDQVTICAAACKKYGVECHVWKVCWNTGGRAPETFKARMKKEQRLQVSFSGKRMNDWLCPSHPDNQKLEINSMLELVKNYDIQGIHLDYIRYPDRNKCFCQGCRKRFEASIGYPVQNWPSTIRSDGALHRKWLSFRRKSITYVVEQVSQQARKIKPGIKISAAVFTNPPLDRDNIGQDWPTWCREGYLDAVCPMDYTPNNLRYEHLVRRQIQWAGKTPCFPGIGLSTWPNPGDVCRLIDQINITRQQKSGGFMVFQYRNIEAKETVPLCGTGITKRRSDSN